jgi:hypothetical protein
MGKTTPNKKSDLDPEIEAITKVHAALKSLDAESQTRVIDYVTKKLKLAKDAHLRLETNTETEGSKTNNDALNYRTEEEETGNEDVEGISPVAKKWISRNSIPAEKLSTLFSLGVEEIDLVAKKIPGSSKREKLRNVFLLKGIAAYLGTGVARITYDQLKEAATHYNAYDAPNFAATIKTMASEASGSKEGGYTLTARGLTSATELIKELLNL